MESSISLFNRLGGTDGIASIVDDLVIAHSENPEIRARFLPYLADPARLAVIKKHTRQFLESGGGGPAKYEGRSMLDAHRGMNIASSEYVAALDDILLTLRKHQVDEQTQKDLLWIAYSLKSEIVNG